MKIEKQYQTDFRNDIALFFWTVEFLLRIGHARGLTPHCGVIQHPRVAARPAGEGRGCACGRAREAKRLPYNGGRILCGRRGGVSPPVQTPKGRLRVSEAKGFITFLPMWEQAKRINHTF